MPIVIVLLALTYELDARTGSAPFQLSMLVLDVDRLKALNDAHGHRTGGDAVRMVGHLIGRSLPDSAFACRFGGDEFVVALPGCAANSAAAVANALRETVHDASPTLAGIAFPRHTLSISIGVAFLSDVDIASATAEEAAGEALFRAADAALYAAKAAGRNQIRLAPARGVVRGNSPHGENPARAR